MLDLETVSKNIMDCKKNQSIGHGWKKDWLFLIDNDQQVEIHLLWICDVNKQWLRGKNDYAWQCWGKEKKGKTIKTINKVNKWDWKYHLSILGRNTYCCQGQIRMEGICLYSCQELANLMVPNYGNCFTKNK